MALAVAKEDQADGVDTAIAEEVVVQKLSKERFEEIILEHREHGRRLAWSFLSSWRVRLHHDEVTSIVGAALCEAAYRFDESRGVAFKTFLFYHLRGMLLKEIARAVSEQRVLQYVPGSSLTETHGSEGASQPLPESQIIDQDDPEKLVERQELANICLEACRELDELEKEIVLRHYVYDEPLIDIAEDLQYCRCHISRVKSRGLGKLEVRLRERLFPGEKKHLPIAETAGNRDFPIKRVRSKAYTGGRGRRKLKSALKLVSAS